MNHFKWTPIKKMNSDELNAKNPIYKTPVRSNEGELRKTGFHGRSSCFSVMPSHITPPSGLTKFIARNPFEADLTSKLHISMISPTVFTKVVAPTLSSPGFKWSVEELALINPAKIEEFPVQQMHCSDPEMEETAQEAIKKFFSENQIFPSPCDTKNEKINILRDLSLHTPIRSIEENNTTKDSSIKIKRDSCTQTVLSLPPQLPPNVEEALKPFFTFTQDQNVDNDEANVSGNSSLRRKLFFNNDDTQEDDSIASVQLSPVKSPESSDLNYSPVKSGMFFHGTPLGACTRIMKRHFGSPLVNFGGGSLCNFSPISKPTSDMSCQSIKSRNRSVTRLDFTNDMSIELSMNEDKDGNDFNEDEKLICKTIYLEERMSMDQEPANKIARNDNIDINTSLKRVIEFKYDDKENIAQTNIGQSIDKSKFSDFCKTTQITNVRRT